MCHPKQLSHHHAAGHMLAGSRLAKESVESILSMFDDAKTLQTRQFVVQQTGNH